MLLGCIADDFTGASDLANTLARNGMKTAQFVGVPKGPVADCEAGVVSLKTRSVAPDDAMRQSLAALDWLLEQGAEQILFKYCSTFDSTPQGNIGPVAEALAAAMGADIAVVCPAFPTTGRTIYQGHLFVGDRLLSESGMENHPLNPMTDPDIRRWLRRQTQGEVALIPHSTVAAGAGAVRAALAAADGDARLAVVDALTDDDLRVIGAALADARLVTGGSSIALGLPENFRKAGRLGLDAEPYAGLGGAAVVLSGSCSRMSIAQVERHIERHPGLKLDPDALMAGEMTAARAAEFVTANLDRVPIVYSTANPETVSAAQQKYGGDRVAAAIEQFFAALAIALVDSGISRIAVGGGETSGAVIAALDLHEMTIGPEIDPGVPVLATEKDGRPLRLALKSGNFGAVNFYDKALAVMAGQSGQD